MQLQILQLCTGKKINEKAGVVLLDLTAAYDTVWLRGLHLKLLKAVQDKDLVSFIMEILTKRSFTLMTSDGQQSRLRRTASHKVLCLNRCYSTSTSTTCRKQLPTSMTTQTTWLSYSTDQRERQCKKDSTS